MRFIHTIILGCCLLTMPASAQRMEVMPGAREETAVNQVDDRGNKHGTWFTTTSSRMGEPAVSEFGGYDHGIKIGTWYKIDIGGDLVSIESFRNNVLDGEVKYYDQGQLYCVGHYRGLNPRQKFDTIMVMHPISHEESYKVIATENGTMRHGTWKYYNPRNGHLVREEEYQVDELVFKKDYEISPDVDSLYRKKHEAGMPHNAKMKYTPPPGKRTSYTHY